MARAVNRIGAESGLRGVAYQRASVHQWLTGTQPRGPVAHLVCAALTERLGRAVDLAEAGFEPGRPSGGPGPDSPPPASPRSLLTHLAAAALSPDRGGSVLAYQPSAGAPLHAPPPPRPPHAPDCAGPHSTGRADDGARPSAQAGLRGFASPDALGTLTTLGCVDGADGVGGVGGLTGLGNLGGLDHLAALSSRGGLTDFDRPADPGGATGPAVPPTTSATIDIRQDTGSSAHRAPDDLHVLALLLPVFSSVDHLRGGGHARTALAAFLSTSVPDILGAATSPVRHSEALAAASRLSYLCAYMHFDDELNGLALHFYRFGLELARQSGDPAAQAMTLRAMAAQAYELGHPQESLRLARAAAELRLSTTATRLRASVLGQLALAEAATGDQVAAVRHVHEAFDLLPRIEGPPPPVGDYHRAAWDHHHALVQAELGDLTGAIKSLETSAARRPRTETRSHALVLGKLAERQLAAGRLDAACSTWHQFLDVYPLLTSRRAHSAAARLHRRLLPHRRRHSADHLLQRVASLRLP
ncbi:tetratricopeptide repeat protein [Kitasatospora sp. NPDC096147]|uniref:tetratricopeptide repeat protein n=1 Tax=Kitasatospora sp. NPDC096147 TaxID=3364093 RepID=UPI00382BC672